MIHNNEGDQVMAFTRGTMLFVLNFNPSISFSDYGIKTTPGRYKIILNSDATDFGGFGRVDDSLEYITEWNGKVDSPHFLRLYIPNRTTMVLEKQKARSIYSKLK
jgi:1,4-alpha-glucan branching enzyme